MPLDSLFRSLESGDFSAVEEAPAAALEPFIPLLACSAVDTPGQVLILKRIQETRLGTLALRYASSDLSQLGEPQEPSSNAAVSPIGPETFQADVLEFEACENVLGSGELRQCMLAMKYLRNLLCHKSMPSHKMADMDMNLFSEPGLLDHLSVLVPVALIRCPHLMPPAEAVQALMNVEAGPRLATTLVCSIPSSLPKAMDALVQAISNPNLHKRGVSAVMALVGAAGSEVALSITASLKDIQLGTHLAIRLTIDHGNLPSWAASEVSGSKARRKWLAEAVAGSPTASQLGDVSYAFRQTMWHKEHSGPGAVQSLRVATMLMASGMRPSLEEAKSWIATMASLPRDTAISDQDLLLCVCLLMLLMPADAPTNTLQEFRAAVHQLLDLREGSTRPVIATAWVLLQLRLHNWAGLADALRGVADSSLSFPETSFTGLAEAASSAGVLNMSEVARAVENAVQCASDASDLDQRTPDCVKGLLKTDDGRAVAARAILNVSSKTREPLGAEVLEMASGLAAAAMAFSAADLQCLLPRIVEATSPLCMQKIGTGVPGAATAPFSVLLALEVEDASRKRGVLQQAAVADVAAEWHEAVRKLPLDELTMRIVEAGQAYSQVLPRWLELLATLASPQTLESTSSMSDELLSRRYKLSTDLAKLLHQSDNMDKIISASKAQELLASATQNPLAAICVLQVLQQQQPVLSNQIEEYTETAKVVIQNITPAMLQGSSLALEEAFVCWWHILPRVVSQELLPILLRCLRAPGGRPEPRDGRKEPPLHLAPVALVSLPAAAWRLSRVCGMILSELPRLLAECRSEAELMSAQGIPDALTSEELETAMLVQESTIAQILLEAAMAKDTSAKEDARVEAGLLAERQSVIAIALHEIFSRHPILVKLVHFQGYSPRLLPFTVACIPAMHFCGDFLGEMIQSLSDRVALFGCQLTGHLASKYRFPWAFAASNSAIARVNQALRDKQVQFVLAALHSLGKMACAFPNLARQVVEILEQIACRKGGAQASVSTAGTCALVSTAEETYEMILDHLALPGEVLPLPSITA